jgi:transposase
VQRRSRLKVARPQRTWRDLPVDGISVALHYSPREILCPTHGRLQEEIPWAASNARNTLRLECELMRLCKIMPQKEAAALLGVPASTVAGILHRVIARCREGHKIRGLKNIGIDEISYKKGHRYLTIVYDLDRHHVVWVGEGKGRETIDRFFQEVLSAGQRARILTACCDMSKSYMGAISHHLPKAILILDRFHLMKALNEAVDEVRKEQWRTAEKAERKTLKGLRFILLKNKKNRTEEERQILAELERSNRRVFRACTLKDEISHFWEYTCMDSAEKFLKLWCKRALLSRIEPLRKFVSTLRNHWEAAFASIIGITNAVAEGINRLLRLAKNRASGFRSTSNFANIIYLIAGDLDLPAQIPAQNRSRKTVPIHHENLCL